MVDDPLGNSPRGSLASFAKLFHWLLKYNLGWIFLIFPKKVCSTLIVFDRSYHDLIVDPKRYRYGTSIWLARALGKFIPHPDLWILLDAPPEIVQGRKQEVHIAEITRQRHAYIDLVTSFNNTAVIDGSQTIEKVADDVSKAILAIMLKRTEKRMRRKRR